MDTINPQHYRSHPSGVECIEVIRCMYCAEANVIKYLWRAGEKDDLKQELGKVLWYLDDVINTGIHTDWLERSQASKDAYFKWLMTEPDGHRRAAIVLAYNGYFYEAKEEVERWLKSAGKQS